jgi:hypothetical protein
VRVLEDLHASGAAFDTTERITVYLPLSERDPRLNDGPGWRGAIALLVVLGVIGVGHAAATAASPFHPNKITCTPGVKSIAGTPTRVFCGPAKASVTVGSATHMFAGGACLKQPRFSMNIGTLSFDPGAKAPYFGLSLPHARAGTYTGRQVTLSFTAGTRRIALTPRPATRVVLRAGLRSGTFAGSDLLGETVTGSFSC